MSSVGKMDKNAELCYNITMNEFNFALVAFVMGFLVAQLWKGVVSLWLDWRRTGAVDLKTAVKHFMQSGGMPSGHSASMAALATYLGCMCGFDSAVFALAVATTGIVVYDATHVRYAVGVQGEALNGILEKNGEKVLPISEGHTWLQVIVGVVLGILIGISLYYLERL